MAPEIYRGHMHTYQHQTNDAVPILGADIVMHDAHQEFIQKTKARDHELSTICDMCNQLKHIIGFLEATLSRFLCNGDTRFVWAGMLRPRQTFYNNQDDIVYSGLNVKMVFVFMASRSTRQMARLLVMFRYGSTRMPFLGCQSGQGAFALIILWWNAVIPSVIQEEKAAAKTEGQLDEQEADPISPTFFWCILNWAIESQNVFIWVFSLC